MFGINKIFFLFKISVFRLKMDRNKTKVMITHKTLLQALKNIFVNLSNLILLNKQSFNFFTFYLETGLRNLLNGSEFTIIGCVNTI